MRYGFEELVDLNQILALMRAFFELTGIPSTIIGRDGTIYHTAEGEMVGAGWKKICLDFHRVHPDTNRNCIESDVRLASDVQGGPVGCYYRCLNGLVDGAIPLLIDGEHVANLFTGQFFLEKPDREVFRAQALRYGFDPEAYLEALDEVPVFDPEYGRRGLTFLRMLAGIIGELGLAQKRLLEQLARSEEAAEAARRAEAEAVRMREAAELASKVRSRFFACASHDLRQPIQAVRLFIDVLSGRLAGGDHALVVEQASQGLASAETILNALFDVARIEAGVVAPSPQPVALAPLFATLAQEFAPQAVAKGIDFRWRPVERTVISDPLMLERIVRNLLANAIRYTVRGGILLGSRRQGGITWIEVWDTGPGIPGEHLQHIWEEFYQVGNVARDRTQGLGLGLSIARKLAATLGHRLEVRSRPGRGTVFRIGVAEQMD